ncbi:hypothetical protein RFI_38428 [Reticulomyxa filosa]|uniref:Uncharacterized protein n=1 Tax=Reticulomyxa filosa TaxID=46433 RepID=X6LE88_RETFI|nr:hypothetical protein RFI_38428 [Reticulomyxa filosa]|eukprot:ETN99059.1 hypothetical protein RFI_38428 [Reticulomyxa filosa]
MPNPNVVFFFFLNNQWRYDDQFINTFANKSPCIGHIYNQCLRQSTKYMSKIIPKSLYVISFDYKNHTFICNDPNFIKDILSTKVDQCMRTLKKKIIIIIITMIQNNHFLSHYQINNEKKDKEWIFVSLLMVLNGSTYT